MDYTLVRSCQPTNLNITDWSVANASQEEDWLGGKQKPRLAGGYDATHGHGWTFSPWGSNWLSLPLLKCCHDGFWKSQGWHFGVFWEHITLSQEKWVVCLPYKQKRPGSHPASVKINRYGDGLQTCQQGLDMDLVGYQTLLWTLF